MDGTDGKATLFEYVVIYNPAPGEDEDDEDRPPQIVVDLERVLAKDAQEVTIRAARAIPDEFMDRLDEVEIAVRPF